MSESMKRMAVFAALIAVTACAQKTETGDTYGEKITLKGATQISAILDQPAQFLGKKVLVQGEVLDVCSMAGCWIDLASDKPEQKIRVKVDDGVIVFPMEAKGHKAKVEGEVYEIKMTREKAIEYYQHVAKEKGETFDPASVEGPVTLYQIKGIGAVID